MDKVLKGNHPKTVEEWLGYIQDILMEFAQAVEIYEIVENLNLDVTNYKICLILERTYLFDIKSLDEILKKIEQTLQLKISKQFRILHTFRKTDPPRNSVRDGYEVRRIMFGCLGLKVGKKMLYIRVYPDKKTAEGYPVCMALKDWESKY